jgi:hypothetical protein
MNFILQKFSIKLESKKKDKAVKFCTKIGSIMLMTQNLIRQQHSGRLKVVPNKFLKSPIQR